MMPVRYAARHDEIGARAAREFRSHRECAAAFDPARKSRFEARRTALSPPGD
jgi:hypothetical protein